MVLLRTQANRRSAILSFEKESMTCLKVKKYAESVLGGNLIEDKFYSHLSISYYLFLHHCHRNDRNCTSLAETRLGSTKRLCKSIQWLKKISIRLIFLTPKNSDLFSVTSITGKQI